MFNQWLHTQQWVKPILQLHMLLLHHHLWVIPPKMVLNKVFQLKPLAGVMVSGKDGEFSSYIAKIIYMFFLLIWLYFYDNIYVGFLIYIYVYLTLQLCWIVLLLCPGLLPLIEFQWFVLELQICPYLRNNFCIELSNKNLLCPLG